MIRILIVDDSPTETLILKNIIAFEKDMEVVGTAANGEEAVQQTALLKPTLITMDIQMPLLDGLQATKLIMMQNPTPIIIISSTIDEKSVETTMQAFEAGALSAIPKPLNITSPNFDKMREHIIQTIRTYAEINVIKRRFPTFSPSRKGVSIPSKYQKRNYELIAIGASVGGPQALKQILSQLPQNFSLPILVVQHMTPGFIQGFCQWLKKNTNLVVKMAEDQEILSKGTVYLAPDNCHLEVKRIPQGLVASLVSGKPVDGFCPSITVLLKSIAKVSGKKGIGIILTGMGSDGVAGMLELKKAEGHTLIQDEASAVVFGMAGIAQSMGAIDKVVELDKIADYLKLTTHSIL